MNEQNKIKNVIIIVSIILFLVSLSQKCYCTTAQCSDSVMAFLLGWLAVLSGGASISWLANPLLLAAWLTLRKNTKISILLSSLATLFAFSFLLFDSIIANEAGQYQQIISYRSGYWIWTLSCLFTVVGTFIIMLKQNNKTNS